MSSTLKIFRRVLSALGIMVTIKVFTNITLCEGTGYVRIHQIRMNFTRVQSFGIVIGYLKFSLLYDSKTEVDSSIRMAITFGTSKIWSLTSDVTLNFYKINSRFNILMEIETNTSEVSKINFYSRFSLQTKRSHNKDISFRGIMFTVVFDYDMACDIYSTGALCEKCLMNIKHPRYYCTNGGSDKICKYGHQNPHRDCIEEHGQNDDYMSDYEGTTNGNKTDEVKNVSCAKNSCKNNGTCRVTAKSITCTCKGYFTGSDCSDVNECKKDNPCKNGATCVNTIGGYMCKCPMEYQDQNCSSDVNECLTYAPCFNNGICKNLIGNFTCECPPAYQGQDCSADVDECKTSNPCENGGSCKNNWGGYECVCTDNYTGPHCQTKKTICESKKPCLHGGVCTVQGTEGYSCACPPGFEGKICESDINECEKGTGKCENGGKCVNIFGDYKCNCPDLYLGKKCEISTKLCSANSVCKNGGNCMLMLNGIYCTCPFGYNGQYCENDINECAVPNSCKNNGKCLNTNGSFQCECHQKFFGKLCQYEEYDCLTQGCLNGGNCDNIDGRYFCTCNDITRSKNCYDTRVRCKDDKDLCKNNGTCETLDSGGILCLCKEHYSGKYCQFSVKKDLEKIDKESAINLWTGLLIALAVGFGVVVTAISATTQRLCCSINNRRYSYMKIA